MPELTRLDVNTTAVLTLDCQKGITGSIAGADRIFAEATKILAAARSRSVRVIHVGIGFRPGYPEVAPSNATFAAVRATNRFVQGTESIEFHPALSIRPEEIVVYKHRISAFSGNDLEMILRSQGIQNLVLFGISTSGIVLSTVRQASDLDFRCTVIADCCFDADPEVHRVLTEKVFPRQAAVVDAHTFLKKWS